VANNAIAVALMLDQGRCARSFPRHRAESFFFTDRSALRRNYRSR
jgi:hypothetical protein